MNLHLLNYNWKRAGKSWCFVLPRLSSPHLPWGWTLEASWHRALALAKAIIVAESEIWAHWVARFSPVEVCWKQHLPYICVTPSYAVNKPLQSPWGSELFSPSPGPQSKGCLENRLFPWEQASAAGAGRFHQLLQKRVLSWAIYNLLLLCSCKDVCFQCCF